MKQLVSLLLLVILFTPTVYTQWVGDPAQNFIVCDASGEQALSKISSLSDGGCYISWFDNRSGNYTVYMQRLDPSGYKQWETNGLLISGNPQSSSLVDYDLMTDRDDNAVVVFTDTRNAGNLNVFAYKISPAGDFLWGADGVSLSTSTEFQADPKVTQTSDGNFVFAWLLATTPTKVALQRLSNNGAKLWGNDPVLIESLAEGFNYPDVVPSDSNSVIVIHTTVTGSFPSQTIKLRATKVGSGGSFSWIKMIQDLGGISFFHEPKVYSDFNDGGIVSWHDDRNFTNLQSGYVQRIAPDNSLYFPVNGANVSLMPSRHKFNPVAAFDIITEETYLFWVETNSNQSQNGISGQKLSNNGTRMWGDNGRIFKDLSLPNTISIINLTALPGNGRSYVFYFEGNAGGLNDKLDGFACNTNGDFLWLNDFVTLSNPTQQKLHLAATVDAQYNCKMSWSDDRGIDRDIYLQDINPDGTLGDPVIVSVNEQNPSAKKFLLKQNYPNPFNPGTVINWQLPRSGKVTLKIFNSLGEEIETLVDKYQEAGNHSTFFIINYTLPGGVYFYQLKTENFVETKKMILLR